MTDIRAVIEKATETIEGWAAQSTMTMLSAPRTAPQGNQVDPRTPLTDYPPPALHINYPNRVKQNTLGATMGPMMPMPGVSDPIFYTVVEVVGKRVGLAYGLWKLDGTP